MRHYTGYLTIISLIILGSACTSSKLSTVEVEEALPLQGWSDVNNLFQDNLFYFSGQPEASAFKRLVEEAGIETVINFRRPQELENLDFDEPALAKTLGVHYVNIPIMPNTFSSEDTDRLAAALARTKGPILMHCGSSNRVGGVWAAYLVRHRGVEVEEALQLGRSAGLRSESMEAAVLRVIDQ